MYKNQLNIIQCRDFNSVQQIFIAFWKVVSLRKRRGTHHSVLILLKLSLDQLNLLHFLYSTWHNFDFGHVAFCLVSVSVNSLCYSVALEGKSLGSPMIFCQHPLPCPLYTWPQLTDIGSSPFQKGLPFFLWWYFIDYAFTVVPISPFTSLHSAPSAPSGNSHTIVHVHGSYA